MEQWWVVQEWPIAVEDLEMSCELRAFHEST
jgi:hypothetical protein